MKSIFIPVVVRRYLESRVLGWFDNFEDAEYAILKNKCDLWEFNYYHYAVVEEIESGLYPIPPKSEQWYKNKNGKIIYIDKPPHLINMVNFSMG